MIGNYCELDFQMSVLQLSENKLEENISKDIDLIEVRLNYSCMSPLKAVCISDCI